jgi:hypothetical protein
MQNIKNRRRKNKLEKEKLKWMKESENNKLKRKDEQTNDIKDIIEEKFKELKNDLVDINTIAFKQLEFEEKIPKILSNDKNKYEYKLLEVGKYEKPDLSNLTINEILDIIGDCTNIYEADQKILEKFYLQSDTGQNSNIRLADVKRNKMLMSDDNFIWCNKKAYEECSKIIEHIGSNCYTLLSRYYNQKMKEYKLDTDDDLEKIMQVSSDPKYKKLWHIHLINNEYFFKNHDFTRSNKVANYIYDYQIPKDVFLKNGYLYVREKKPILTKKIELII